MHAQISRLIFANGMSVAWIDSVAKGFLIYRTYHSHAITSYTDEHRTSCTEQGAMHKDYPMNAILGIAIVTIMSIKEDNAAKRIAIYDARCTWRRPRTC